MTESDPPFQDLLVRRSLQKLEEKLGLVFNIPFPVAVLDIDVYRRQPLGLLVTDAGTVVVTRPVTTPQDDLLTLEWMTGLEQVNQLGKVSLDALVDMDEKGDFIQFNLIASPEGWAAEEGTSMIQVNEGEAAREFMERALRIYRARAGKSADPKQANLLLSGFEKVMMTLHQCRKEEALK